ncbi:hypothetical protein OIU84_024022 [Salix udensis]|uniref:Uncharacterized protein n=1 Tax=Salix udensis TaxID=889485 RepID=A0AAD6KI85_9ROSI|nr:hypothetical protein OIU84_024022 [Salix udensis]
MSCSQVLQKKSDVIN